MNHRIELAQTETRSAAGHSFLPAVVNANFLLRLSNHTTSLKHLPASSSSAFPPARAGCRPGWGSDRWPHQGSTKACARPEWGVAGDGRGDPVGLQRKQPRETGGEQQEEGWGGRGAWPQQRYNNSQCGHFQRCRRMCECFLTVVIFFLPQLFSMQGSTWRTASWPPTQHCCWAACVREAL